MTSNVGTIDRVLRLIVGVVLLAAPFVTGIAQLQSTLGITVSVLVGMVLIATSTLRFCPLYRVLGIKTCKL